ncbi:MmgE/PrpD family protein [Chelativorans sp. ZYF759]|uniref:MmgE/PrpD family protein n=1 Tax=Chelativorans sp. ZYF759 TaxID=2692213 RepID=UPI00145FB8BC|nr:MmgE/PrpD family protein [Chelativorans sp. ZYF759]NMG41461.1 MmgE/PrpD family protein [Chelativorans sp. ZYF759]
MTHAARLADFAIGFPGGSLPTQLATTVNRYILDIAAVAAAGSNTRTARQARQAAPRLFGRGETAMWFDGASVTVKAAVFANATAASILDLDDGHRAALGHPGAGIIPAVLAAAPADTSWNNVVDAIAIGYEVALRVGAGRPAIPLTAVSSGRWVGIGVAAAVARLRGLSATQTTHAIAIATTMAPDLAAFGYVRETGNSVKEGISWASVTGLAAVDLAEVGHTGPRDIFDHASHYVGEEIIDGLGDQWLAHRAYLKRYSCCRWIHALIDGIFELRAQHTIPVELIKSIEVETFEHALGLGNEVDPMTIEGAQYSIPYCTALACVSQPEVFLPLTEAHLHQPGAVRLSKLVKMTVGTDLQEMFPVRTPGRIRIITGSDTFVRTVLHPLGDPANPLSDEALFDKCRQLCVSAGCPQLPNTIAGILLEPGVDALTRINAALADAPASR